MKVFGRQDGGFEDKVVSDALVYFNDTVSKLPLLEKKMGGGVHLEVLSIIKWLRWDNIVSKKC